LTRITAHAAWRAAAAVVVGVSLLGAVQARQRIAVWADNLSFWTDVASKVPDHSLPHRELADALMAQNRLDEAEQQYKTALTTISEREGQVMAYNNLGNLYMRRGQLDQAETAYREGIALFPHPRLFSGLGRLAIERARKAGGEAEAKKQLLAAQDALSRAVAGEPADYRSHNLLGQVLFNLGKREEAKTHFEISLTLNPAGQIADIARNYLKQIGG
jgi:tetratricopeptide (TPR) repeat protein